MGLVELYGPLSVFWVVSKLLHFPISGTHHGELTLSFKRDRVGLIEWRLQSWFPLSQRHLGIERSK